MTSCTIKNMQQRLTLMLQMLVVFEKFFYALQHDAPSFSALKSGEK